MGDNPAKRELRFNRIYVIESLDLNERHTGSNLYNDLLKWTPYKLNKLSAELIEVKSKIELFDILERVKENVFKHDHFPYLHFEIHGNPSGIVLNNGEQVSWVELGSLFQRINYAIHNHLFVSFATCYGAHIFEAIDITSVSPFFAFLAPPSEVQNRDIEAAFTIYFETLLRTFDGDQAVDALNKSLSESSSKFICHQSEQVFELVAKKYIQRLEADPSLRKERSQQLLSRMRESANLTSRYSEGQLTALSVMMIENTAQQSEIIEAHRSKFLMHAQE